MIPDLPKLSLLAVTVLLLATGCVLPSPDYSYRGEVLVEKETFENVCDQAISASYSYPDVRVSFVEDTCVMGRSRIGARVMTGEYGYSFWGECQEIFVGPVMFLGGLVGLAANIVTIDFKEETAFKLLHLVTILPVFNHRDYAKRPEDAELTPTDEVRWKRWRDTVKEGREGIPDRTINVVSANGTVLYQTVTNAEGDAFIDVADAYDELFADGLRPARVVELETGKSAPCELTPEQVRKEAREEGDPDPSSDVSEE